MKNTIGLLLLSLIAGGCGVGEPEVQPGVTVTGVLVKGGTPLQVPQNIPGAMLNVELIPVEGGGEAATGTLGPDGSFKILGPGEGIVPGQYKLALGQSSYLQDQALQQQFSRANTPIQVDVPADKVGGVHDLGTIDLDQPAAGG